MVERIALASAVTGRVLLDATTHLTWSVASKPDDMEGIEDTGGVLELVINGVLVSLEGIQHRDSHPRTEVFAALGQPVLAYGARSSRDQVQQAGRGMILPTCQVDDAGEFTRAPEASILVVPHVLIDPQHPHPCETGGVIRCGLQVAWEPLSPSSGSEPDLFADLATASESNPDGATTASSLDFSRPIGDQIPVILDGYRRVDNVTDATLASYREHYGDAGITKEDIFFYVYALLHHPEYRERYEDDLKKMLPHIPRAAGFHTYASVGRELADLHVNYERVEPYPSVQEEASLHAPEDPWKRYRIGTREMRFPKLGRKEKDYTRLEYNEYVTLVGIPEQAQHYTISGRSPLDWVIDRYYVKTDKASGIVNDPNAFLREQGHPDAVVDLIKRLVTVSMRTQELLATLPALEIPEGK